MRPPEGVCATAWRAVWPAVGCCSQPGGAYPSLRCRHLTACGASLVTSGANDCSRDFDAPSLAGGSSSTRECSWKSADPMSGQRPPRCRTCWPPCLSILAVITKRLWPDCSAESFWTRTSRVSSVCCAGCAPAPFLRASPVTPPSRCIPSSTTSWAERVRSVQRPRWRPLARRRSAAALAGRPQNLLRISSSRRCGRRARMSDRATLGLCTACAAASLTRTGTRICARAARLPSTSPKSRPPPSPPPPQRRLRPPPRSR